MTGNRPGSNERRLTKLLAYVRAAKKAETMAGHQGDPDTDNFHMGKAAAYQDVENLLQGKGKP